MKFYSLTLALSLLAHTMVAQIDAGLFRYPDVSQTHIVFTYANDLWVVPKAGGLAYRLSSPAGVEIFAKFSPDGKTLAFTGNYDGNDDVYVIPSLGGVPTRLTYHGLGDRVVDWYPDGKNVLFASPRESGRERFNQFYKTGLSGGLPQKLPLPYAEFGSVSPDGKQLAVTFRSQVFRNWKRYRGGWNAEIHLFNLETLASENISVNNDAADELPMWHGTSVFFLSDRGAEKRMNLWEYNTATKAFQQITKYADLDVHHASVGPEDIVFEQAGKLFLFNIASRQTTEVKVEVVTDGAFVKPVIESAKNTIEHSSIAPDGSRVLIEARGEVFNLPAEDGFVKNITQSSGIAERSPSWSPDGKWIAYWSDRSGEYELTLRDTKNDAVERKLTSYGAGFRYNLFWSPDSKKIAFIDKAMRIKIVDVATGQTTDVDRGLRIMHGGLEGFSASWSPDSRWLTYDRDLDNGHQAVFLYDYQTKKLTQATSGFYSTTEPVFSADGKHLFVLTNQFFQPSYSDIDNTFIYPNSTKIAAIALKKSTASILAPKNDVVKLKEDKKEEDKPSDKKKKDDKEKDKDKKDDKKEDIKPTEIDLDGLESRLEMLSLDPGNYGNLLAIKGKILFHQFPNTGARGGDRAIKFYDIEKRETKTIVGNADGYDLSADGSKLLIRKDGDYFITKIEENQKTDKKIRTDEMQLLVNPREEWKQIVTDAWRLERDYFYDPTMHGVNWTAVKDRYLTMLNGALTREEVNFVLGEMIGELNASHTYKGGGDEERSKQLAVGYLGIDWQAEGEYYKVKKIIRGAPWDAEVRSPLDMPGVNIQEGNYILAINGVKLTTALEPYAAFQGLSKRTVEITYSTTPSWSNVKTAVVETLGDESRLRHLAWIEQNRKRVEAATDGKAGYVYVRSTGIDGQNELIRQFNAQMDKKALIIDERFNSGGQIPDRFIELLNRPALVYWATRDGASWPWPPAGHFGPKVMLINGWSGSGGDAFPDYFRKTGLGPLIGARTWGGLIGISGAPNLIDGGSVTVPTFRMYNLDGTWFKEGYGVDPDIEVPEDLTQGAKGVDTQLERGIVEIQNQLKSKGFTLPKQPAYEVR